MAQRTRDFVLLGLFVILLHAPFLRRAIHNDEVNYLDTAANVFWHPLTPTNFEFIFQGMRIDMSGHPHPPLNAYCLALLWWIVGRISPLTFHVGYLVFPVVIAVAAYAI